MNRYHSVLILCSIISAQSFCSSITPTEFQISEEDFLKIVNHYTQHPLFPETITEIPPRVHQKNTLETLKTHCVCHLCYQYCLYKDRYNQHMNDHETFKKLTCPQCNKFFITKSRFNAHKKTHKRFL